MKGRGDDLNQAFGVLPMFFADTNDLMAVLHRQDEALSTVFANTADIFEAIDSRPGQLTELIISVKPAAARHREPQPAADRDVQRISRVPARDPQDDFERSAEFTEETQPLINNIDRLRRRLVADAEEVGRGDATTRARSSNNLEPMLDRADAGLPATDEFFDARASRRSRSSTRSCATSTRCCSSSVCTKSEITAFLGERRGGVQAQYNPTRPEARRNDRPLPARVRDADARFARLLPEQDNRQTRSNAYPSPGWSDPDRLAAGLQVFDQSRVRHDSRCRRLIPTYVDTIADHVDARSR